MNNRLNLYNVTLWYISAVSTKLT